MELVKILAFPFVEGLAELSFDQLGQLLMPLQVSKC